MKKIAKISMALFTHTLTMKNLVGGMFNFLTFSFMALISSYNMSCEAIVFIMFPSLTPGPLLHDIKEKFLGKVHESLTSKPQVYLISGHDMTLINVMRTLGLYDLMKPDIGATLLLELHAGPPGFGEGADFVKVYKA